MTISGDVIRNERLVALMAGMARGDANSLFTLIDEFHADLLATVRSTLSSLGRSDVARRPADLDFLVSSAGLVLFDRAAKWQCGGAPPWIWAGRAIRAEVVRWLGHPRVEFVAERHASNAVSGPAATNDLRLEDLADRHEAVAGWLSAVEDVASERDRNVHLEYQLQKSLGDPSPANTVGAQFGLSPANVRQIDARVRRRLRAHGIELQTH